MKVPKKKRSVSHGKKNDSMFIPNIWLPVELTKSQDTEHSLRSAFCFKDRIQWFYLVKNQRGFSDFEKIRCECCKGDLFRDEGFESGFSASEEPEVVACLLEHPTKKKTLALVFILSNLEMIKSVLLDHLLKHDFSGLYGAVTVMESGSKFHANILKQSGRKKLNLYVSLSDTIELKKPTKRRPDYATLVNDEPKENDIKEKQQDRLQRQKFSELAKGVLKLLLNNTASVTSLENYKEFKKNQKTLNLQFPTVNLKNALMNYVPPDKTILIELKRHTLSFFPSGTLILRQKVEKHPRKASHHKMRIIGSISRKSLVSTLKRSR